MVARSVCWRGSASRSPLSRSRRCESRSSSCSAEKTAVRAAASSIASGSSSSRAQSSSHGRRRGEGRIDCARASEEERRSVVLGERRHRPGLLAADAQTLAARDQQASSRSTGARAPRCSAAASQQLLDVVEQAEHRLVRMCATRPFFEPSRSRDRESASDERRDRATARAAPRRCRPGRLRGSAAACRASRVLPVPPGPVRVSRRASSAVRSSTTSDSSCSRPRKGVAGTGRFVR